LGRDGEREGIAEYLETEPEFFLTVKPKKMTSIDGKNRLTSV
jgi:hypothetical protein